MEVVKTHCGTFNTVESFSLLKPVSLHRNIHVLYKYGVNCFNHVLENCTV